MPYYTKAQLDQIAAIIGARIDASRRPQKIFQGTPSTGQNIQGAKNTEVIINWDATTNNATYVDTFSNGSNEVIATIDDAWKIQASVGVFDQGVNNRTTFGLILDHFNSSDTLIDRYFIATSNYVRDDNNLYDSGIAAGYMELPVSAGDKIEIVSKILDTQTTSGTVDPDNAYSQITIHR